jgi:hypothetical protein
VLRTANLTPVIDIPAMTTHNRHHFPPGVISNPDPHPQFFSAPFIEPPQNLRADNLLDLVQKGGLPGVETPITPDEADVLDAGDVVEGLGVGGLARGSSTASGCVQLPGSA